MPRTRRIYRVVGHWPDGSTQTRHYQSDEAATHRAQVWLSEAYGGDGRPARAEKVELHRSAPVTFDDEPSFVFQPWMYGGAS